MPNSISTPKAQLPRPLRPISGHSMRTHRSETSRARWWRSRRSRRRRSAYSWAAGRRRVRAKAPDRACCAAGTRRPHWRPTSSSRRAPADPSCRRRCTSRRRAARPSACAGPAALCRTTRAGATTPCLLVGRCRYFLLALMHVWLFFGLIWLFSGLGWDYCMNVCSGEQRRMHTV